MCPMCGASPKVISAKPILASNLGQYILDGGAFLSVGLSRQIIKLDFTNRPSHAQSGAWKM